MEDDDKPPPYTTLQSSRSRETLINGHHDESHTASHNTADVSPRFKETAVDDGITSQNAIPQKQSLYSPRSERTNTHNALGNSASASSTRYHRSNSSSANSLSSHSALGRQKRTKSESDAVRNVCQLEETIEHPICRRNAVKELKQGAGWSGSYMRSELKSPDKPDHKWNWGEAKIQLQASLRQTQAGHDNPSGHGQQANCNAPPPIPPHGSHSALRHGHHSYNANSSGHKSHSHSSAESDRHSNDISGFDLLPSQNAPLSRQHQPSHGASERRHLNPSHNASGHNLDSISHNSIGQNLRSHSVSQSRRRPDTQSSGASEGAQIRLRHNTLANGHALTSPTTSLDEPVWRRQSADLQKLTQGTGIGLNQAMSNSPNQFVRNSQLMRNIPNQAVRNSPNQTVINSPNQAMRNSPNQTVRNSPNQAMRNSPNQAVRNSPNPIMRSSPNDVVKNLPTNQGARSNPDVRKNESKVPNPSQGAKETEINGVLDDVRQDQATTTSKVAAQPPCAGKELVGIYHVWKKKGGGLCCAIYSTSQNKGSPKK